MASVSVSSHIVSGIVQNGAQNMYNNYLQKQKVPGYSQQECTNITKEFMVQIGSDQTRQPEKINLKADPMNKNIPKDLHSYRSLKHHKIVNSYARFRNGKNESMQPKSPRRRIASRMSPNHSQSDAVSITKRNNKRAIDSRFIKIQQQNKNKDARIIPQKIMKEQKKQEQQVRLAKMNKSKDLKEQAVRAAKSKKQIQEQKDRVQREFEKSVSDPNTNFTFDIEGKTVIFQNSAHTKAIQKQYPPTTKYFFDDVSDCDIQIAKRKMSKNNRIQYQKMRAAEGQAFASAVLKTVNLSRISMNSTLRDPDPATFMKRNDLFNNNHTRQTSSIPYLQMKSGTTFTELETNLSVTNKDTESTRTQSHYFSARRTGFKKFTNATKRAQTQKNYRDFSVKTFQDQNQKGDFYEEPVKRQSKTGQHSRRKLFTQTRPRTSGNTGRITTVNEELVNSMIHEL